MKRTTSGADRPGDARLTREHMRAGFPRRVRLRRTEEIRGVLRRGRRLRSGPVAIFLSESDSEISRAGIIVPRHGQSAVARNRLKRQLREIVRIRVLPALALRERNADILVRARPEAYAVSYADLVGCVMRRIPDIDR